jgi:hypothetical protein
MLAGKVSRGPVIVCDSSPRDRISSLRDRISSLRDRIPSGHLPDFWYPFFCDPRISKMGDHLIWRLDCAVSAMVDWRWAPEVRFQEIGIC